MNKALSAVALARRNRHKAERAWHAAILTAYDKGASLREIAGVAGVTYGRVGQIVRKAARQL